MGRTPCHVHTHPWKGAPATVVCHGHGRVMTAAGHQLLTQPLQGGRSQHRMLQRRAHLLFMLPTTVPRQHLCPWSVTRPTALHGASCALCAALLLCCKASAVSTYTDLDDPHHSCLHFRDDPRDCCCLMYRATLMSPTALRRLCFFCRPDAPHRSSSISSLRLHLCAGV